MTADSDRYHHGNLRRALLAAAVALAEERRSFDFTMRELARKADVTHSAPYRHFNDKSALLAAIATDGFRTLRDDLLQSQAANQNDPRVTVEALGTAYVLFAVTHPQHFRLMFGESLVEAKPLFPELALAAEQSFAVLRDAIERCRKAGILKRDISVANMSIVAWSLVHGLASLAVAGQLDGTRGNFAKRAADIGTVFFEGALGASMPKTAVRPRARTAK